MIAASKQVAWGFWLRWVAATTVGFALGPIAVGRAQAGVEALLRIPVLSVISANLRAWSYTALFVAEMTLPGLLQWLILRRWCSRAGWWVLASGVGLLLGGFAASWGVNQARSGVDEAAGPALVIVPAITGALAFGGALAGTVQWLVLRRWVPRSGWWVLGSVLSWAVAGLVSWYLMELGISDKLNIIMYLPLVPTVRGALSGAISGVFLVWLLEEKRGQGGEKGSREKGSELFS